MGSLQALEVLKQITGMGENLAGKILITDTLAWRFRVVSLAPRPPMPALRLGSRAQGINIAARLTLSQGKSAQTSAMAREIHYEVFRRVGARGGWTLHEVTGDRTRALNQAQGADGDGPGHRRQGGQGNLQ